jgi:hypothetical protein
MRHGFDWHLCAGGSPACPFAQQAIFKHSLERFSISSWHNHSHWYVCLILASLTWSTPNKSFLCKCWISLLLRNTMIEARKIGTSGTSRKQNWLFIV